MKLRSCVAPAGLRPPSGRRTQRPRRPSPRDAGTPQSVDEKLQELDQKIRVLDRKIEIDKEAAAEKAKTAGQAVAGKDGFSLRSADGNFLLKLRGYVQFDGRFWVDDEQRPQVETFLLRRVRPIFEGTVFKIFDFRIMPDFGGGTDRAPGRLHRSALHARLPASAPASSSRRSASSACSRRPTSCSSSAPCRPTWCPTATSACRSAATSPAARSSYAVGVFNGVVDGGNGDARHQQRQGRGGPRLLPAVRRRQRTAQEPRLRHRGEPRGTRTGRSTATGLAGLPHRAASRLLLLPLGRAPPPAPRSPTAPARASSPQGYCYSGPFGLLGRVRHARAQDVRRDRVVRHAWSTTSWQVAGSWVLAGGEASYRGVTPKKVVRPGGAAPGAPSSSRRATAS